MKDDLLSLVPRVEVTRRAALKLLATGIAALETGCFEKPGDRDIVPYVQDPPELRPGLTTRYTGALTLDGFGFGVIVDTHEGRPTKLDGNPAHPASLGGSLPWVQARILDLYDPQRSREPTLLGQPATWPGIAAQLRALPRGPVWIVMPPQSSPTIAGLLARIAARHDLRVVYHAPLARTSVYRGHELVYGRALEQQLDLARADVIVALDADPLGCGPMAAAWSRAAASRRNPESGGMSRLWVAEPMQTPTGTLADERLAITAGDIAALATLIAAEVGVALPDSLGHAAQARLGERAATWARHVAADLAAHRGASAIIAGDRQPPVVHALARMIDHALGNPVVMTAPAVLEPLPAHGLDELATAATPGTVLVLDCDPLYTAPHVHLAGALARATFSLHAGLYANATSGACRAHVPLAHDLETWTDPRAFDGTLAIGQPTIRPRFEVASIIDVLAELAGITLDARTLVHDQLRGQAALAAFDTAWTTALRTGVVAGTASRAETVTPTWHSTDVLAALLAPPPANTVEIALAPSPALLDGRFAPNAWLQELPHPITKQTWGNAALMSRATASALGVSDEDLVRVRGPVGEAVVPAMIVEGAAERAITIELGHGQHGPAIAAGVGTDVYGLGDAMILRATVTKGSGTRQIPRTQLFMAEHGREIAPLVTLAAYQRDPKFAAHLRGDQASLLPDRRFTGVQWGMSIDTSICSGCSACMVACQAENNIPTVGPENVAKGRAMHWIRIDRYIEADRVVNEPMLCQHCENAPCEYVCPVNATDHSPDGLNEQVYNRCVGTRFCANNCPYKVRRFNWFAFEHDDSRSLQYNPDVTVRSRGVMEKCSYCVQRIRGAEHRAIVEHRAIQPREVVTACQAACPTGAIQFGMLDEHDTAFAAMRTSRRRFEALHDLGTRPRTQYLAKVANPKEGA